MVWFKNAVQTCFQKLKLYFKLAYQEHEILHSMKMIFFFVKSWDFTSLKKFSNKPTYNSPLKNVFREIHEIFFLKKCFPKSMRIHFLWKLLEHLFEKVFSKNPWGSLFKKKKNCFPKTMGFSNKKILFENDFPKDLKLYHWKMIF